MILDESLMTMNRQLKRTLPYLNLLKTVDEKAKKKMLKSFPTFVIDDMVEILYNILSKNVTLRNPKFKKVIDDRKRILRSFYGMARQRTKRKKVLLQQKGGFLGAMIPIIASVLGGLAGSAL